MAINCGVVHIIGLKENLAMCIHLKKRQPSVVFKFITLGRKVKIDA